MGQKLKDKRRAVKRGRGAWKHAKRGEGSDRPSEPTQGAPELADLLGKGPGGGGFAGSRQLVEDGTRVRRRRVEHDQPRLLSRLKAKQLETDTQARLGVKRARGPDWRPRGEGDQKEGGQGLLEDEVLPISG